MRLPLAQRHRSRRALLVVSAVAALACTSAERELPTWTMREMVRVGSGDEGPTSFSWVKGVAADARGRIFIYEHSTQDIRVFGPDGAHLQTIGRKGAGPGELANAEGIAIASDGRLWVRDAANGRFSIFTTDGEFLSAWPASFCFSQGTWAPVVAEGRLVDVECIPGPPGGNSYQILGYRIDKSGVDTLGARPECGTRELTESATWITRTDRGTTYRQIPFAPRALSAIDGEGAFWCAPNSGRYEIVRLSGSGDTIRVARELPPLTVPQSERDSVIADIESRGPTGVDFDRMPTVRPAIERLSVDDRGRLWVRRSNPQGAIVFDIIERDGSLVATAILGDYRSATWSPFVVQGDDVYAVLLGEDDVPQVAHFRIER